MSSFENPTPPHHEQAQSTADAPENSSRRDFFRNMVGIAAVTAYDAVTGRPAKAAEDVLEGLGSLATRKERGDGDREVETGEDSVYGEVEQLVGEPTVEDLALGQIIDKIKKRYGIAVQFSDAPEIIRKDVREVLRALLETTEKTDDSGLLRDAFYVATSDEAQFLMDKLRQYREAKDGEQKSAIEQELFEQFHNESLYKGERISAEQKKEIAQRIYNELRLYPDELLNTLSAGRLRLIIAGMKPTVLRAVLESLGKLKPSRSIYALGQSIYQWNADPSEIILRQEIFGNQDYYNRYGRETMHHELFHRIDDIFNAMEGDVLGEIDDWRATYLKHGGSPYLENESDYAPQDNYEKLEGFSSKYSKKSPEEDRAEVAGKLFVPLEHVRLLEKGRYSFALREKIAIIKDLYEHVSGGIMDGRYWRYIKDGDLDGAREYVQRRSQEQHGEQYSEQEEARTPPSTEQLAQQQRKEDEQAAQEVLKKINQMK